jgi:ferric hydroxamate transport system permease protein
MSVERAGRGRYAAARTSGHIVPWVAVFGAGPILLILLVSIHIAQGAADISPLDALTAIVASDGSAQDNIVRYIRMPRAAIGITTGIALAMAGALLQSITRNPLASPATLGISAGAYFALVAATVFVPGVLGQFSTVIPFLGGMAAAGLAYVIAGGMHVTPIRLALGGIAVSLVFSALTALLQLFYEYQVAGLFFWGAGSLLQNDWSGTEFTAPRLLLGALAALLLSRSLEILELGDDVARGLGQRVEVIRLAGLVTGVFLAATAVSVVGPIGFVGLLVPHLVRLMGVARIRWVLLGSAIWGPIMLVAADVVARTVTSSLYELPAGGITALIGAPFFVWLARRSGRSAGSEARTPRRIQATGASRFSYRVLLASSTGFAAVTFLIGLMLGDVMLSPAAIISVITGNGTDLASRVLLDFRIPRLLVAAFAGAALALSGTLLQGVIRNPLAAPEIVGVSGGAGLAALAVLVFLPGAPFAFVPIAAFIGAFAAFGLVYAASWRGGVSPNRLALVGIAVSAFCAAGINLLVVQAQLRVAQALVWLSGSTYARGWDDLIFMAPGVLALGTAGMIVARQTDLIGLGDDVARGIGASIERLRIVILSLGVGLAALAISVVGTIGFVGLIGPHAARLLLGNNVRHRQLLPVAALLGANIVMLADIVGRTVLAPREIPAGLVTALIGAPYFLWLLWRNRRAS